jgi:ABC-type branched-subunit amino acid transport system permease subunit
MKKYLPLLGFIIFFVSVVMVSVTMANCGMQGFFMVLGCQISGQYCSGIDSHQLDLMRNLVAVGLVAAVISFVILFSALRFSWLSILKTILNNRFKQIILNFREIVGQMKPFDGLASAISSGIIQPKVFCL